MQLKGKIHIKRFLPLLIILLRFRTENETWKLYTKLDIQGKYNKQNEIEVKFREFEHNEENYWN